MAGAEALYQAFVDSRSRPPLIRHLPEAALEALRQTHCPLLHAIPGGGEELAAAGQSEAAGDGEEAEDGELMEGPGDGWVLPPPLADLIAQRYHLRQQLDTCNLADWNLHTKTTNPFNGINFVPHVDKNQYVIKGMVKFMEMLERLPGLVTEAGQAEVFTSLHVCEGDGGALLALKRYLSTTRRGMAKDWDFVATTLNTLSEAFLSPGGYLAPKRNVVYLTEKQWEWGPDDKGDLFDERTRAAVLGRTGGGVRLATADGLISRLGLFTEEQEAQSFPLFLAETWTALSSLQTGGAFLIKLIGLSSETSVSLVAILAASFNQLSFIKPSASSVGSSEVYLACLGFRGRDEEGSKAGSFLAWYSALGEEERRSLCRPVLQTDALPEAFVGPLLAVAGEFIQRQNYHIQLNLDAFRLPRLELTSLYSRLQETFTHLVHNLAAHLRLIEPLKDKHILVSMFKLAYMEGIRNRGTAPPPCKRLMVGGGEASTAEDEPDPLSVTLNVTLPLTHNSDLTELASAVVFGKAVKVLMNSLALGPGKVQRWRQATGGEAPSLIQLDLCPPDPALCVARQLSASGQDLLVVELGEAPPSKLSWLRFCLACCTQGQTPRELIIRTEKGVPLLFLSRFSNSLLVLLSVFYRAMAIDAAKPYDQPATVRCSRPASGKRPPGVLVHAIRAFLGPLVEKLELGDGDGELLSLFSASTLIQPRLLSAVRPYNEACLQALWPQPPSH